MTPDEDIRIAPFLAPESEQTFGLKLRPFSAGSYLICQRRGLSLFTGGGTTDPAEQAWQMAAFLYLQAAPIEEVLIASGNEEAFRKAVDAFAFTLTPTQFREGTDKIARLCGEMAAASVEVEPKPSAGSSEETPPPNF